MTELLSYALEGATAVVTMDDGKANALSEPMIDALTSALSRAESEASAMVLCGRPDRFCGGFDIKVMMSGPEAATALTRRGAALLMKLYGAKVPLVIACTGHALAGGALVVLTGDLRIGAAGSFRIDLNEVSIGLPVPILAMALARDRLTPSELPRATLLSRIYDPEGAVLAGYLDEVLPAAAPVELCAVDVAPPVPLAAVVTLPLCPPLPLPLAFPLPFPPAPPLPDPAVDVAPAVVEMIWTSLPQPCAADTEATAVIAVKSRA